MKIHRFFNPLVNGADRCVIIVSATYVEALNAYVDRYYPDCHGVLLSVDFNSENAIIMEQSVEQLDDGVVVFCNLLAIDIV